ncbi:hypothetical protein PR202_ga07279 [Eleusine coracana subsp. coracana]|uniref:F-box domain-containing protein n=1 Tax=Eleusine coracana subsp. coracana TaxID=191504 RepID=A0AAV5BYC5_ELECO|nr:hypothetical protein PR202_ga07279 [Eleusine coracana subsp. coracana]
MGKTKMSSFISRSMVLGNKDLLSDILLCVDSPTTLVRATLVSKHWYHGASCPFFLRRFSEINPQPRLLGAYSPAMASRARSLSSWPSLSPVLKKKVRLS